MWVVLLAPLEGVGAYPGAGDGDPGGLAEPGQVGGQRALQGVGLPAHRVLRLAHVQTLGEEARVFRCQREERGGPRDFLSRRIKQKCALTGEAATLHMMSQDVI